MVWPSMCVVSMHPGRPGCHCAPECRERTQTMLCVRAHNGVSVCASACALGSAARIGWATSPKHATMRKLRHITHWWPIGKRGSSRKARLCNVRGK